MQKYKKNEIQIKGKKTEWILLLRDNIIGGPKSSKSSISPNWKDASQKRIKLLWVLIKRKKKISITSVSLLRKMCCIIYQICGWQGWWTVWCVFAKVRRRFSVMVSLSDFKRLNSSAVKTAGTAINPGRKHFHKKLFLNIFYKFRLKNVSLFPSTDVWVPYTAAVVYHKIHKQNQFECFPIHVYFSLI